jgi:hypothetical protein
VAHIAQLAIMGAVTALVRPTMPSHNAVAAGLVGWFGLTAQAIWWLQARRACRVLDEPRLEDGESNSRGSPTFGMGANPRRKGGSG